MSFKEYVKEPKYKMAIKIIEPIFTENFIARFFDGVAQQDRCGGFFYIILSELHYFHCRLGCMKESNTKVGLMALWGPLFFVDKYQIYNLHVLGKVIIHWVTGKELLNFIWLEHWCNHILELKRNSHEVVFKHVYREANLVVDLLSKKALELHEGFIHFEEYT